MTPTGFAHPAKLLANAGLEQAGGAESGAFDADLALVVGAWPTIPPTTRALVLALIEHGRSMDASGQQAIMRAILGRDDLPDRV